MELGNVIPKNLVNPPWMVDFHSSHMFCGVVADYNHEITLLLCCVHGVGI